MAKEDSDSLKIFLQRTGGLLVHLLNKCNLYCEHCYLDSDSQKNVSLPIDLINNMVQEAECLGIKLVQFSGGEPFLYPHIEDVLKLSTGKKFKLIVSTNSTLIDGFRANLLAKAKAHVVTSIDGPENYHNAFRGKKNAFEDVLKGINQLIKFDIPIKVVMTVSKENVQHIDWCVKWAYEMGVKNIQFQPLESVGRGNKISFKQLEEEDLLDLFIQLKDLSAQYDSKGLKVTMTYKSRDFMLEHPCTAFVCNGKKCHRGVEKELKKIVIREDGLILPELVDIDKRFAIGDLFKNTLEKNLINYLNGEGYARFDKLCREVYNDTVPNNPSPLISWNEILTKRSYDFF